MTKPALRQAAAALLGLALVACDSDSSPAKSDPAGSDGMLQVVGVVALASGAPATVTLEVTGQFPDVCTHLKDVSTVRQRTSIEVTLTTQRSADFCILLYPDPTLIPVPLPGVFAPGDYVAHVNGREVRFSV